MSAQSAAEQLTEWQSILGNEYGSAVHYLRQELWSVTSYWDRYETLFGTTERVSVVNQVSGTFWHDIQAMLFDNVLLGLSRLTDRAETFGRANLTIDKLLELDQSPHKGELQRLVNRAKKAASFARSWRNRRIAHNNFEQITGAADLLAPATRRKVERAIVAIHDVLRWIGMAHADSDMFLVPIGEDDAAAMMLTLSDGVEARDRRYAALLAGDLELGLAPVREWTKTRPNKVARYSKRVKLRIPKGYRTRARA